MTQSNLEKSDFASLLRFRVGSSKFLNAKKYINDNFRFMDLCDTEINPDGELFGLALKNSSEMLRFLVDIYVQTKLQGDPHSIGYLAAKRKLGSMLEEQIDSSAYELEELDEEVQAILRPWMSVDEDSDNEDYEAFTAAMHAGTMCSEEIDHQAPPPAENFAGWPSELSHGAAMHGTLSGNYTEVEAH